MYKKRGRPPGRPKKSKETPEETKEVQEKVADIGRQWNVPNQRL